MKSLRFFIVFIFSLFIFPHTKNHKVAWVLFIVSKYEINKRIHSVIWAPSCTFFLIPQELSQQLPPILCRLAVARMFTAWVSWGSLMMIFFFMNLHTIVLVLKITVWISRNVNDPPQRGLIIQSPLLAVFISQQYSFSLGLLLSHSCTIGLIKQRTIRELSFNEVQVPLNQLPEWADNAPIAGLGFTKKTQKICELWGVDPFLSFIIFTSGQFWIVHWVQFG